MSEYNFSFAYSLIASCISYQAAVRLVVSITPAQLFLNAESACFYETQQRSLLDAAAAAAAAKRVAAAQAALASIAVAKQAPAKSVGGGARRPLDASESLSAMSLLM